MQIIRIIAVAIILFSSQAAFAADATSPPGQGQVIQAAQLYLKGLEQLEAKQKQRAIELFDQAIALDPKFAAARMDRAITLYKIGRTDEARADFMILKDMNPPEQAKSTIDAYLLTIDAGIAAKPSASTAIPNVFLEAGVGYDNNVSAVTSDFTNGVKQAYGISSMLPTGNAISRSSPFYGINGGFSHEAPLVQSTSILFRGGFYVRDYSEVKDFDLRGVNLGAGLAWGKQKSLWVAMLQGGWLWQEGALGGISNDSRTISASLEYRKTFVNGLQGSVYGVYSQQRFADQLISDVDSSIAGFSLSKTFKGKWKPAASAGVFRYVDEAVRQRIDGTNTGRDGYGLRAMIKISPAPQWDVTLLGTLRTREDDKAYSRSSLISHPKDISQEIALNAQYMIDKNWSVRGELRHTQYDSDLQLYTFNRTDTSVWIRYKY